MKAVIHNKSACFCGCGAVWGGGMVSGPATQGQEPLPGARRCQTVLRLLLSLLLLLPSPLAASLVSRQTDRQWRVFGGDQAWQTNLFIPCHPPHPHPNTPPPHTHMTSPRLNSGIRQRQAQSLVGPCRSQETCQGCARAGGFGGLYPWTAA